MISEDNVFKYRGLEENRLKLIFFRFLTNEKILEN